MQQAVKAARLEIRELILFICGLATLSFAACVTGFASAKSKIR